MFDQILHYVCDNYETLIKNDTVEKIYYANNYLNDKINDIFNNYTDRDKKIIMMTYIIYLKILV